MKIKVILMTLILSSTIFSTSFAYDNASDEKVSSSPKIVTVMQQTKNDKTDEEPESTKHPYKASENTARESNPVIGNVNEKSNVKSPTKQGYTTGTITENVGENGKPFPKDVSPLRQFLTFKTNDGKEFHLIIDYLKNEQQVRMLTEVNESDLLNLIDKRSRNEDGTIETEEEMESRIRAKLEKEYKQKEEAKLQEEKTNVNTKEKSSDLPIILMVVIGVLGFLGFKKFMKKKQSKNKPIDDNPEFSNELSENDYYEEDDDLEFEDENKNK